MKFAYKVIGYEEKKEFSGQLTEAVAITVSAKSDTEALKQAKKLIKKKHYVVAEINEIYQKDGDVKHEEWIEQCKRSSTAMERTAAALERIADSKTQQPFTRQ